METNSPDSIKNEEFHQSGIEYLASGVEESDTIIVALKRLNKQTEEWLESYGDSFPCLFCGCIYKRSDIKIVTEQVPKVEIKDSGVKVNRYAFIICKKCAAEFDKDEELNLDNWISHLVLFWQIEFLEKRGLLLIDKITEEDLKSMTRGEARNIIAKFNETKGKQEKEDSSDGEEKSKEEAD